MNIYLEVIKTSSFFIDWGISMMDFVLSILSGIISGVVSVKRGFGLFSFYGKCLSVGFWCLC